jgi:small subunit ribosomal protein S6
MRFYETIFILDVAPDVIDAEIQKVTDLITANNGQVVLADRWGMRKFAYEIKHKNQGFYTCIYFNGAEKIPGILENHYKLNENCLRYLTVVSIHTPEEIASRAEKVSHEEPPPVSPDQAPVKTPSGKAEDETSEAPNSDTESSEKDEPEEPLTDEGERKSPLADEDMELSEEQEPGDETAEEEEQEEEEEEKEIN